MPETIYNFAVITEEFPPTYGGGIAEWALGIAENLSKLGYKIDVYSKWKGTVDLSMHSSYLYKIHKMGGHDWHKFRFVYSAYYLFKYLKKNPNGIILSSTWELANSYFYLKKLFPDSKMIFAAHGLEVTKIETANKLKVLERTCNVAEFIIAVSNFTKKEILKRINKTYEDKVKFIPNGVNLNRFNYQINTQEIYQKLEISKNTKIILTLARVIKRKGHDTVIQSLPKILEKFSDTLYIIGGKWEKDYYDELISLIDKLNLKNHVRFTGFIPDKDLNLYYSICNVYVMVSRLANNNTDSEGFGITFLEANACRKPVIGSSSGGIKDAIENGMNGFVIPPDEPNVLADKIIEIFSNPELAVKLGKQGRERIKTQFTWEIITKKILDNLRRSN